MNEQCPCGIKKPYLECCGRFHHGRVPLTAEELMRSRYSAYALGLSDYIMETTHPNHADQRKKREEWKVEIASFSRHTTFVKLEVKESEERGEVAFVTFRADMQQGGQDVSFTEKSRFLKVDGRWLYLDGVMV